MPSLRLSYQLLNIVYLLEASYNAVNLFCYQYKLLLQSWSMKIPGRGVKNVRYGKDQVVLITLLMYTTIAVTIRSMQKWEDKLL